MSLSPFSIIVAVDSHGGIAKDGCIPWHSNEDMRFFRETTIGKKRNAVIMGRITYESIPKEHRPLVGRHCVVITRTWKQEDHPEISIYTTLVEALAGLGNSLNSYDEIFVAGGEQIYKEVLRDFLYLCKRIYVTRFKANYNCDQFFSYDSIKDLDYASDPVKTRDYVRYIFAPKVSHDEYSYLSVVEKVKEQGEPKPDRSGIGTKSLFGMRMEFDISERLPLLTTKKVSFANIVKELLFFVSGKTDTKILEQQGVNIWKGHTSKEFLQKNNLEWDEGDMGPLYSHQWRHWGAEYEGANQDYREKGIDQLQLLIDNIRNDPHSRRHILSAWNPSQLNQMSLPPCHVMAQFYVSSDRRSLDCQLYQRSGDLFLGVPYNIASYAILTYMIGHITGLRPRRLIHIIGDAHIYVNHSEQVNRQLKRTPRPFPKLSFRDSTRLHEIDDFTFNSFILEGYNPWPVIQGDIAI